MGRRSEAITIQMMRLSEISISPELTGSMVLNSRNDVRHSLDAIVGKRPYIPSRRSV